MKYRFQVKGSAAEPYEIEIERVDDNLRASCTCPAGENGQYCKHRFSLFNGSASGVVGGDLESISALPNLVSGTDVEYAMIELTGAERELAIMKKQVSAAKKAVAKAMRT